MMTIELVDASPRSARGRLANNAERLRVRKTNEQHERKNGASDPMTGCRHPHLCFPPPSRGPIPDQASSSGANIITRSADLSPMRGGVVAVNCGNATEIRPTLEQSREGRGVDQDDPPACIGTYSGTAAKARTSSVPTSLRLPHLQDEPQPTRRQISRFDTWNRRPSDMARS